MVAYFGDGASNIGAFHESLNLASLWKLPVIFVCQNNRYGEHTRYDKATSVARIAERAIAYAMPGGQWTATIRSPCTGGARSDRARPRRRRPDADRGDDLPLLRPRLRRRRCLYGSGGKGGGHRGRSLSAFRAKLIADGIATEAELAAIEAKVEAEIDEAVAFALDAPFPGLPS